MKKLIFNIMLLFTYQSFAEVDEFSFNVDAERNRFEKCKNFDKKERDDCLNYLLLNNKKQISHLDDEIQKHCIYAVESIGVLGIILLTEGYFNVNYLEIGGTLSLAKGALHLGHILSSRYLIREYSDLNRDIILFYLSNLNLNNVEFSKLNYSERLFMLEEIEDKAYQAGIRIVRRTIEKHQDVDRVVRDNGEDEFYKAGQRKAETLIEKSRNKN